MITYFGVILVICGFVELVSVLSNPICSDIPSRSTIFDCCHRHFLLNNYGVICAEKLPSQIQPSNTTQFSLCLAECIFKEAGIITNTLEIDIARAKDSFHKIYHDSPEFIPILESSLEECIEIVKRKMEEPIEIHLGDDLCDPETALTAQCTLLHSLSHCPRERGGVSHECQQALRFFSSCDKFFSV